MNIQDYFNQLKRKQIDDVEKAKDYYFENHCAFFRSRSKMETQLRSRNIAFTYTDKEKKEIQFRLSNISITSDDYRYQITYDSHEGFVLVLNLHLFCRIDLSSFLAFDAKIPQLYSEWKTIQDKVQEICEQNFKKNWERLVSKLAAESPNDTQWILKRVFEKILEHKIQTWQKEFRPHDDILSEFRRQGCPFHKEENGTDYFYEFGELKITYTHRMFSALIGYKGIECYTDREMSVERVRALAEIIPTLYNQTCDITNEAMKRTKLRSINQKTMENLLESKMQELSLEYAMYQWDGKKSFDGKGWYDKEKTVGIELKIKCKNRRCLMFHVRYEKMEQFLKILDELPKTIQTINALPFNALVSIYGNDVKWKKSE